MAPNERRQDASAAAASASATNNTLYLAIGVGVGVAIILAITGVAVRIVLKKKQHQRAVAELEQGAASAAISPSRNMQQLPRLATGTGCSQMMPRTQQGWDGLGSSETLNEPGAVANPNPKRLRSSMSLPKKFRNRGIQFGRNKYLSAIVELESPISEKNSPNIPQHETMEQLMASSVFDAPNTVPIHRPQEMVALTAARSESPKLDVLPSLATRYPVNNRAATPHDDGRANRVSRSASAGLLVDTMVGNSVLGRIERASCSPQQSESRGRSLSLGAPTSQPPSGPVPPIPVRSPRRLCAEFNNDNNDTRQQACISRMSSSSIDSASSSVLATSPILTRNGENDALHSPTLEDVVTGDQHASLKTGSNRQWQVPRITGPRPNVANSASKMQESGSMRGSIIRFSSESVLTRTLSSGSTSSEGSIRKKRMSIAQVGTANSIVMSRVSSTNSLHGSVGGVQKVSTPPRKTKRQSSVSASGSPAERRRAGILRDISGNANKFGANRESSDSTLNSGRSSCGNPFQWDPNAATLNVPSALKGSPNARKGHRRQNCVRISTLTPQVLGPAARSRSASPAGLMHRIKEERESEEFHGNESDQGQENVKQLRVQKRRPNSIRQSSHSTLPDNLRIQTLRASFTPDSPTSSTGSGPKQAGLTLVASDSNLSVSPDESRSGSRQSDRSSGALEIPKFPTPSKSRASVAAVNRDAPLPQFSLNFADDRDDQPPFALASSPSSSEPSPVSPCSPGSPLSRISQVSPIAFQLPSSPPLQTSAKKEYDPAWPVLDIPLPGGRGNEYDPASPPTMMWDAADPERSSWFLPFAAENMFNLSNESKTQTSSVAKEASPPCSPKSSPSGSPNGAGEIQAVETLTSSTASQTMSLLPSTSSSGALGLNSIPILLPPTTSEDPVYQLPEWKAPAVPNHPSAPRPRRVTSTGSPNRIRRRSPEPFLPTIPQSSSPPPAPAFHTVRPLNIQPANKSTSPTQGNGGPKGPRNAPAKSVLNNVSALRRMDSETNAGTPNRQSRNWQRLGREPSPLLLPWTGAILPSEDSSTSLFDFDFGTRTSGQYTQGGAVESEPGSAVDESEERTFDRVLDGALAGFHAEFKRWSASQDKSTENGEEKRTSSVWDDGERFWTKRPEALKLPFCKVHSAESTPRKSAEATCDPTLLMTSPAQQMGTQMSSPATMANTPGSLYDADGFLKS